MFFLELLQVCDEPHPVLIKDMLQHCVLGHLDDAYKVMAHLWRLGYSAEDIITIVFRVCKNHSMPEYLKLEFIKVSEHVKTKHFTFFFIDYGRVPLFWNTSEIRVLRGLIFHPLGLSTTILKNLGFWFSRKIWSIFLHIFPVNLSLVC